MELFLIILLLFIKVESTFFLNKGCHNIKQSEYDMNKLIGSWNVIYKSSSSDFDHGCQNYIMNFNKTEDYAFEIKSHCYNDILKTNIFSHGYLFSTYEGSYVTYAKNNNMSWNRHFYIPFHIYYLDTNLLVIISCFDGYDSHLQNKIQETCDDMKFEDCSIRNLKFELCNYKCKNVLLPKIPPKHYEYTNIWVLSRSHYFDSIIFKNLIRDNFSIDDLVSIY
jgi:hypothetical protein